jgi:type I restriction enzyme S subunit
LPSGWKEEQLGEIADVGWGDLQVTKSSFIDSGFIAYSAAGPDGFREGFDFDQDGIVLSAIGAGCGRTWYAKGRWSCIKNTIRILEKSDEIKLEFLYQQLSDPNAWPKRGSGQPFISQKDARELMVKVPPLSEQAEIVQILEEQLSRLDASLAVANAIEKKASAFRRSLLHAAFSGNLTKEWREGAHV